MSCNVNINDILNMSKDKQSAFDWNTILYKRTIKGYEGSWKGRGHGLRPFQEVDTGYPNHV
jgi:hypothetical protein